MMEGIQNYLKWINYLHSNIIFLFFFLHLETIINHFLSFFSSSQYFPSSSVCRLSLSCSMKISFLNQLLSLVTWYRHVPEDVFVAFVGGNAVSFEVRPECLLLRLGTFFTVWGKSWALMGTHFSCPLSGGIVRIKLNEEHAIVQ